MGEGLVGVSVKCTGRPPGPPRPGVTVEPGMVDHHEYIVVWISAFFGDSWLIFPGIMAGPDIKKEFGAPEGVRGDTALDFKKMVDDMVSKYNKRQEEEGKPKLQYESRWTRKSDLAGEAGLALFKFGNVNGIDASSTDSHVETYYKPDPSVPIQPVSKTVRTRIIQPGNYGTPTIPFVYNPESDWWYPFESKPKRGFMVLPHLPPPYKTKPGKRPGTVVETGELEEIKKEIKKGGEPFTPDPPQKTLKEKEWEKAGEERDEERRGGGGNGSDEDHHYIGIHRFGNGSIEQGFYDIDIQYLLKRGLSDQLMRIKINIRLDHIVPIQSLISRINNEIIRNGIKTIFNGSAIVISETENKMKIAQIHVSQRIVKPAGGLDHFLTGRGFPPSTINIGIKDWDSYIFSLKSMGATFLERPVHPQDISIREKRKKEIRKIAQSSVVF